MTTAYQYRVRVNEELRQQFQTYCKEQNLNTSELVRAFLDAVSSQPTETIDIDQIIEHAKVK